MLFEWHSETIAFHLGVTFASVLLLRFTSWFRTAFNRPYSPKQGTRAEFRSVLFLARKSGILRNNGLPVYGQLVTLATHTSTESRWCPSLSSTRHLPNYFFSSCSSFGNLHQRLQPTLLNQALDFLNSSPVTSSRDLPFLFLTKVISIVPGSYATSWVVCLLVLDCACSLTVTPS